MRRILIVGAGQCGLLLAHGLLRAGGYEVTVQAARTPDEIRAGRPTSTQVLFGPSVDLERRLGLDLWARQTPPIAGLHLTVAGPSKQPRLEVYGALDEPARSTDQRVKMATWLELFEEHGGIVRMGGVTARDLDDVVARDRFDLIIVAAGRDELIARFDVDRTRSPYAAPQRGLAVVYVNGMGRDDTTDLWPNVTFTAVPGMGELILIPALSNGGPCDIVFFEVVPGGPWDVFTGRPDPVEHLARSVALIARHMPWLTPRITNLELADAKATLTGRYAPTVRHPVAELPSGTAVWGAGDVVIANDPIMAQGANTATRCAAAYLKAIVDRGDQPFDRDWMNSVFETFWAYTGAQVTAWTNAMLCPPPPHVRRVLAAAARHPAVANRFAHGFADPNDLADWFMDPTGADSYLTQIAGGAVAPAAFTPWGRADSRQPVATGPSPSPDPFRRNPTP